MSNWTPLELNTNYLRWRDLIDETEKCDPDCVCKLCLELMHLAAGLERYSEDQKASAVIEANKLESEFIRL